MATCISICEDLLFPKEGPSINGRDKYIHPNGIGTLRREKKSV